MTSVNYDFDAIRRAGPYHHDIILPNGENTAPGTKRMRFFEAAFWPSVLNLAGGSLDGLSVLDVGCNCGGFSFLAKRYGAARAVGFDVRPELIAQARLLNSAFGYDGLEFVCADVGGFASEHPGERFDIVLLMGILYHFANPIAVFRQIADLAARHVVIDSHVHHSTDSRREEMPLWWMLADTDQGEFHDVPEQGDLIDRARYLAAEVEEPVDYCHLPDLYRPGPHKERDLRIARRVFPNSSAPGPVANSVRSDLENPFSMVPNRAALIKLARAFGFSHLTQIEPPRIAEPRYLLHHRIVLTASRGTR